MEIGIRDKNENDLVKKIINYNKINNLVKPIKRYEITAIDLVNKNLYLKIKNNETGDVLRIVLTTNKRKDLLSIDNKLFFYYYSDYLNKFDNLLCKNIMKIMYSNINNNRELFNTAIDLIKNENIFDRDFEYFEDEDTGRKLQVNKKNIAKLEKNINLNLIKNKWPNMNVANEIFSYDETRLRYKLIDKNNQAYFLKIFTGANNDIDNLIKINKLLADKINVPKVIDFQKDDKFYWVLYEFLDPAKILDKQKINLAVKEIVKFHNVKFDMGNQPEGSKFNKVKNNYYLYKEEIIDKDILEKALNYLQNNLGPKGWCHFDLEMRHFIYSNDKMYLTDIDSIKYDYIVLDLGLFIRYLLKKNQSHFIAPLIELYLKNNKSYKFDKKILFYATIIMVYYKEDENLISNHNLHKNLNQEINLIRNYFNI
ncbi:MAG: phosphotransferase [Candidatus Buchananbacteria bacterium]|nr:phosphotransferase [Candidatus Buchananbacteria bacterium]